MIRLCFDPVRAIVESYGDDYLQDGIQRMENHVLSHRGQIIEDEIRDTVEFSVACKFLNDYGFRLILPEILELLHDDPESDLSIHLVLCLFTYYAGIYDDKPFMDRMKSLSCDDLAEVRDGLTEFAVTVGTGYEGLWLYGEESVAMIDDILNDKLNDSASCSDF